MKIQINENNGLFLVKSYLQSLKISNNTNLLRFVVDGGVGKAVDAAFKVGGKVFTWITSKMHYLEYTGYR